jgi:serine/threonine-protein kinase
MWMPPRANEPAALEGPERLGDYELLARLGSGRNCEVFLAVRRGAARQRIVALKRMRPGHAKGGSLSREAELASRIKHPHVVDVYEHGEVDGACYIAMEYLAGQPLGALIRRSRGLPAACVAQIGADIADGLDAAHRLRDDAGERIGLVHLDVSPSNIQVLYDGRVMLLDFGLARSAADATARGKIGYLAPEQVRRERADARTDVFALGVILWEALTGKRLFKRDGKAATLAAIVDEPAPPPSSRGVSGELDEILARALAGDPSKRFDSAGAMAEALADAVESSGVDDPRSVISALMLQHFEAERTAASQQIDDTLAALSGAPLPVQNLSDEGEPEYYDEDEDEDEGERADQEPSVQLEPDQRPGPRRGRAAAIGVSAIAVAVVIVIVVSVTRGREADNGERDPLPVTKASEPQEPMPHRTITPLDPDAAPPPDARPLPKVRTEAPTTTRAGDRERARDAYRAASKLLVTGDTAGAIQKFRESLTARPGYAPAFRGLGLAHERRGDTARALRYYKRYLRAAPEARDAEAIRERVERLGG